jgi:hypothetical protein
LARKKKDDFALTPSGLPKDYAVILETLKSRIRQSQTTAMLSVNRELIHLYWDIGKLIAERQDGEGWGRAIVERLADDVQKAFPGMGGFSRTNVFRMRAFYLAYTIAPEFVPQAVGQTRPSRKVAQAVGLMAEPPGAILNIPWGHPRCRARAAGVLAE